MTFDIRRLGRMNTQRGFTILELMLSVAVGAILVGIGVPSFVNTIRNSEMTSATNGLVGALYAARSEAVKQRTRVTVCRAQTNSSGDVSCAATGDSLAVFTNASNDLSVDTGSGDVIVRSVPWLADTITVSSSDVPYGFSFNASGFTRALNGDTISGDLLFCGPRGNDAARVLTIAPTGRPTIREHADVSGAASCT